MRLWALDHGATPQLNPESSTSLVIQQMQKTSLKKLRQIQSRTTSQKDTLIPNLILVKIPRKGKYSSLSNLFSNGKRLSQSSSNQFAKQTHFKNSWYGTPTNILQNLQMTHFSQDSKQTIQGAKEYNANKPFIRSFVFFSVFFFHSSCQQFWLAKTEKQN